MFLVFKMGINPHGVSVCDKKQTAIDIANEKAGKDRDDYHRYAVYELIVNQYYDLDADMLFEKSIVYSVRKEMSLE